MTLFAFYVFLHMKMLFAVLFIKKGTNKR